MKTGADIETLDIPACLLAEIRADAEKEQRPAAEVLRNVIERGLEEHRWQRVQAHGAERAKALGLTGAAQRQPVIRVTVAQFMAELPTP